MRLLGIQAAIRAFQNQTFIRMSKLIKATVQERRWRFDGSGHSLMPMLQALMRVCRCLLALKTDSEFTLFAQMRAMEACGARPDLHPGFYGLAETKPSPANTNEGGDGGITDNRNPDDEKGTVDVAEEGDRCDPSTRELFALFALRVRQLALFEAARLRACKHGCCTSSLVVSSLPLSSERTDSSA